MSDIQKDKIHWSFWLVAALLLIWNLLGSMNFLMQLNPEIVASYPDSERAMIQGRPIWASIAFGLSVFGGALGCIFLLLKKPLALYILIASLVGTVAVVGHSLTLGIHLGVGQIIGIVLLPIAISIFLVWYAKYSQNKWFKNT